MNLIEGLLSEIDRVTEIKNEYDAIPGGRFAASLMELDIKRAKEAIGGHADITEIIEILNDLKGYTL